MPATEVATTPYWSRTRSFPQYEPLTQNTAADVVTVGGGITGLTAAYLLARAGRRTIVFERRRCASVDTGHTSAHLTMVTDTRLSELITRFGRDHAQAVWDAGLAGIALIDQNIREIVALGGRLHEETTVDEFIETPRAVKANGHTISCEDVVIATIRRQASRGTGSQIGTLAGIMISDAILGRPNPWAALFDPGRKALTSGTWQYLKENIDYPYYMIRGRFAGAETRSLREIKRGEGQVIERNGAKVAAYREESGKVMLRSAACTHMGCVVGWNQAERTWDFPCHGSRFGTDGQVISGPAETPLAPAD